MARGPRGGQGQIRGHAGNLVLGLHFSSVEKRGAWAERLSLCLEARRSLEVKHALGPGASNPLTAAAAESAPTAEAWVSAPAVDGATDAARCRGAGETPLGLHLRGRAAAGLGQHVGAGRALGGPGRPLRRVLAVSPRGLGLWTAPRAIAGPAGGARAHSSGPSRGREWAYARRGHLGRAWGGGPCGPAEAGVTAGARRGYTVSGPLGPRPGLGSHQGAEPRTRRDHVGRGAQSTRATLWGAVSRGERNVGQGLREPGF